VVERLLIVVALVVLVAGLIAGGRALARRRFSELRAADPGRLWAALRAEPDGRLTIVAFSTPSCAACKAAQEPALTALQARVGEDLRLIRVDAAERPEVARTFGVLTVPATVVLDRLGRVAAANQGFATADQLALQLRPRDLSSPLT
jgi:thiol-disulfide isomerase/thioredoxin